MSRKIFVNLPVKDLAKSIAFYKAIGCTPNPQFSDETGACMVVNEHIYAMLLTHEKFMSFSPVPVADAWKAAQVLVCLSVDSKAEVGQVADAALAAGGKTAGPPQDYGFMIGRCFHDPDGHIWEVIWMDPSHVAPAAA